MANKTNTVAPAHGPKTQTVSTTKFDASTKLNHQQRDPHAIFVLLNQGEPRDSLPVYVLTYRAKGECGLIPRLIYD